MPLQTTIVHLSSRNYFSTREVGLWLTTRNPQEISLSLFQLFLQHHSYKFINTYAYKQILIMQNYTQPPILEITIISAQDLKRKASFTFSRRIRPFVILSSASPAKPSTTNRTKVHKTRVDEDGGLNPTWGDKFRLSLGCSFFDQRYPGIYLQLYTKHLLMGQSQLGWCQIPASDILSRFCPVGSTQFLSYRLRSADGSRGHGVVNVAVRLEGPLDIVHPQRTLILNGPFLQNVHETDQSVIGIPANL